MINIKDSSKAGTSCRWCWSILSTMASHGALFTALARLLFPAAARSSLVVLSIMHQSFLNGRGLHYACPNTPGNDVYWCHPHPNHYQYPLWSVLRSHECGLNHALKYVYIEVSQNIYILCFSKKVDHGHSEGNVNEYISSQLCIPILVTLSVSSNLTSIISTPSISFPLWYRHISSEIMDKR